jgi:leucyl-tRNA---protein transferase
MYSISYLLDSIKGEDLDKMLEFGMFRNGKKIFTTNFLQFNNKVYSALWLRVVLSEFKLTPKQKEMIKRNKSFEVRYGKLKITEEKERLYEAYRSNTAFKGNITLEGLLNDHSYNNVYDSREITIYDNGKLIGCGVYDIGESSSAGIVSFFDNEYKKYSIGKYLILLKILDAKKSGFKFFYPGYFAPGYSMFDYKLDFAKNCTEYLNVKYNIWLNTLNELDYNDLPIDRMRSKLSLLKVYLDKIGISNELLFYYFFDSNIYVNFGSYEPLTAPYIIMFKDKHLHNFVVAFDLYKSSFVFFEIHRFEHNMVLNHIPNTYEKHLLVVSSLDQKEFSSIEETVDFISLC